MDFIGWIIIGAVAGGLASLIVPGRTPGGMIGATVVGMLGGLLGGFIFTALGLGGTSSFIGSVLVAVLGAVLILYAMRAMSGRSAT